MKRILFYIALCIALSIYLLQHKGFVLPNWINNYVNDFLTLPLVLSLGLFVIRKIRNEPSVQLPFLLVISIALFYSLYFEWYLPQHNHRYTSDWLDCVLYFAGAILFYFLQKSSKQKKRL